MNSRLAQWRKKRSSGESVGEFAVDSLALSGTDPTHRVQWELAKRGITAPSMDAIVDVLSEMPDYDCSHIVEAARRVEHDLSGLGPLAQALADPQVTDVGLNPNGDVWRDRGQGMELHADVRVNPQEIRDIAVNLASRCGVRLDDAYPFADGVLTDLPRGVQCDAIRVHAVLSPPAADGASISLRVLKQSQWTLHSLVESGLMSAEVGEMVKEAIAQRKNFLVSGGTGTGKTTLLACLISVVAPDQRIVMVEDTPELMPTHRNLVKLVTRKENADGRGGIGMQMLVKQCLRMRPDRIVVGEVRGAEIVDLLVAFNTGHAGSAGTIHANSAQAVPGRLLALGAMAGIPAEATIRQVLDGIDLLLHLERKDGKRELAQIGYFHPCAEGLEVRFLWERGTAPERMAAA